MNENIKAKFQNIDKKQLKKEMRRKIKRFFGWNNMKKILTILAGIALVATTVLPYIL